MVMATLERQAIAFVLSMLKVDAVIQRSELLCYPTASTMVVPLHCCQDACDGTAHTSAFCIFLGRCRRENAALV